jgi:hypothetical protein
VTDTPDPTEHQIDMLKLLLSEAREERDRLREVLTKILTEGDVSILTGPLGDYLGLDYSTVDLTEGEATYLRAPREAP